MIASIKNMIASIRNRLMSSSEVLISHGAIACGVKLLSHDSDFHFCSLHLRYYPLPSCRASLICFNRHIGLRFSVKGLEDLLASPEASVGATTNGNCDRAFDHESVSGASSSLIDAF